MPSPGLRVRLTDTSLFVTLVPYQLGDLGTVLQPCAMSGLWWVEFDRDRDNPMRLPASAFAAAGDVPPTSPEETAVAGLLDDLEPVPVDEPPPIHSALFRSAAPLDVTVPAAPTRQHAGSSSHAGDARLTRATTREALTALDDLH